MKIIGSEAMISQKKQSRLIAELLTPLRVIYSARFAGAMNKAMQILCLTHANVMALSDSFIMIA